MTDTNHGKHHSGAHILIRIFAAVLGLFGLGLLLGGVYLITLGGSLYYALVGAALVFASVRMWQGRFIGVWVFLGAFVATVVWALFEVGFAFWPLVPRIAAPLVMMSLALFLVPLFSVEGGKPAQSRPFLLAGGGLAVIFVLFFAAMFSPHDVVSEPFEVTAGQVSPGIAKTGDNWVSWGKSQGGTRYAPLGQINRDNVAGLETLPDPWLFRSWSG